MSKKKTKPKSLALGWRIYEEPGIDLMFDSSVVRSLMDATVTSGQTLSNEQKADPSMGSVREEKQEKREELVHPGLKHFLERMEI